MQAMAAEGIVSTLDQMDSDIISRLKTPDGALVLLPYPTVTVDMGQYLARMKTPLGDRGAVDGLRVGARHRGARRSRARGNDSRDRHPPVRRRHARWSSGHAARACALKKDDMVWLTDTDAILKAAVPK